MPLTPDLSSYSSVQSNLFVRIQVDQYRSTEAGSYTASVLRFSDDNQTRTINGESYTPLGRLMAITASTSELRTSSTELTISISGIPNSALTEIMASKFKGSPVIIYRLFSNAATGVALAIAGNPSGRYRGFVNNWGIEEEYNNSTRTSTNIISIICTSTVDVLQRKVSGRKTNPESQKLLFPSDVSMDRVPTLENATFNFGAPR